MAIVLHGLLTSLAAGTGLVFNGYILVVLLWYRRIQTANNLLLLHLAFVDTVFCVVVIAGNASWGIFSSEGSTSSNDSARSSTSSAFREVYMPAGTCEIQGYAWTALPVIVLWTVCGLSCDRYAAIATPLHYSRLINTRRASYFLAGVWILGFVIALPPLFDVCTYGFYHAGLSCLTNCTRGSNSDLGYAATYVTLAVILPLVVVLICNYHILIIARYHKNRIVSAIYHVTLSAQATVVHQKNPFYLSKFKGKNAIFTIFQLVGSLLTLSSPYFGIIVWEASTGSNADPLYVTISLVLFTCTPPVNAYVYGVKSRVLRQTFKTLLQRHLNKREAIRVVESRASLNPSSTKRTLCRRGSAPAGYLGWENAISAFSRSSPFTGSLKAHRDSSYSRTRAFHRRPSFVVEVGSPTSGIFQEIIPKDECESPKSGLWMNCSTSGSGTAGQEKEDERDNSSVRERIELPEIVITAPCVEALNQLLSRRIGFIGNSQSEPNSPDINHQKSGLRKLEGVDIPTGSPVFPRRSPPAPNNRMLQRRKTIYSILPVRNQLPEIKEVTDDAESSSCNDPNITPNSNSKCQSTDAISNNPRLPQPTLNVNNNNDGDRNTSSFVCKLTESYSTIKDCK